MKIFKSRMNLFLAIGEVLCAIPVIAAFFDLFINGFTAGFDAHSLGLTIIEFLPFSIAGSIILIVISRRTKVLKQLIMAVSITMYATFVVFVASAMLASPLLSTFFGPFGQILILNIMMIIFCVSVVVVAAAGALFLIISIKRQKA